MNTFTLGACFQHELHTGPYFMTFAPRLALACIACLCFEISVCPWPDLSSLFQYTSPTLVVSLHSKVQYNPGIPVTLLIRSSL